MNNEIKVIPNFVVYASDFKVIKDKLNNDDIVFLLDAIADLCLYGETDYKPHNKFSSSWFNKLTNDFEQNSKRYLSSVNNGKKGGRPRKNPQDNPQDNPNETDGETIKYNKIKENKIEENNIKNNIVEVEESNNYGSYFNVFLLNKDYQKLQRLIMNNKILDELIEDLSVNIETGKEKPYQNKLPHAHYERLKAYFKYRKDNPKCDKSSGSMSEERKKMFEELEKRFLTNG